MDCIAEILGSPGRLRGRADRLCGLEPARGRGQSRTADTRGLGFMIQSAAQFLNTDIVVLGILVIALVAFAMEAGLRALQRRWVPWQGRA